MDLMCLLLNVLIVLTAVIIYYIRKKLFFWKERGIPCDIPHLIMGSLEGFTKTRTLQEIYLKLYSKFKGTGPFCGMYFFQRPMAFILDPQLAKRILISDFSNFTNRNLYYNEQDDPLTGHLFTLEGNKWKELREKLTPIFTPNRMKFMFPTLIKVTRELVASIDELLLTNSVIDMKGLAARFIADVIGNCIFGIRCNSLSNVNEMLSTLGIDASRRFRNGNILFGFMHTFPDLAHKLKMRLIPEDIHQLFMNAVREAVAYREQHGIRCNDFMDLLIELKNSKDASDFSVEQIAAKVFVFFVAGFETAAATISFTLYELARHTVVQNRVRSEVNAAIAKHHGELSYELMHDLPYMTQVISEIMRLHTTIPQLIRQSANDYVVPEYPKYKIPKGMSVLIPSCAYHLDAELYPEPYAFKPERFASGLKAERDPITWLAFGEGPRDCIGIRFGQMQICIGLALLLKNFKFTTCSQTPIPMKYDPKSFIIKAKDGIFLHVERLYSDLILD